MGDSIRLVPGGHTDSKDGSLLGSDAILQARNSRVRFPMSLDFSVYLVLLAAPWLWFRFSL
jgi:hypothetical protein